MSMKVVFCHDNIYYRDDEGHVRSEGQFDSTAWARYLRFADELVVVGRSKPLDSDADLDRFNISERPGVRFVFVPDLHGPIRRFTKRRTARRTLEPVISSSDAVILRAAGEITHLCAKLARRMDKPAAAEVVGCPWDALWNYGTWQGKVFAPYNFLRTRHMIANVPFAIYVSREFLQRRYPNPGHTAVASNVDIPAPEQAVLERRLDRIRTDRGPPTLGLIGTLKHRYKGVHVAIRALAKARRLIPKLELRILGGGDPAPWVDLAEDLAVSEATHFCGTLPSGQPVLDWLDEIDLYVQPSFQEGVPRALIEAMSRACPALASSAGGIGELLERAQLHDPGDHERLARQVVKGLSDEEWQVCAAKRNFEVASGYSREVLSERRKEFWSAFADHVREHQGQDR